MQREIKLINKHYSKCDLDQMSCKNSATRRKCVWTCGARVCGLLGGKTRSCSRERVRHQINLELNTVIREHSSGEIHFVSENVSTQETTIHKPQRMLEWRQITKSRTNNED